MSVLIFNPRIFDPVCSKVQDQIENELFVNYWVYYKVFNYVFLACMPFGGIVEGSIKKILA